MKITASELKKIIAEEAAKLATEAPNIPDVMGAMGGGKFQPRHEVIEVVDSEMGDILFFSDRPVQLSADGPSRKPDSDIGDWNALVKDLKLRPEDVTDTLMVKKPGHSMYELSHDQFSALELALEKENNPSLKNVSYTPDVQRESKTMKVTKKQLRSIIREAMDVFNVETGEIIDFGEESRSGLPDAALRDLVKRLGLNMSPSGGLSNADFDKLEQETIGKQGRRSAKRKSAQMAADRERLNIDKLLQRLRYWAEDAGQDYMADNPGVELQDVAYDLADAWQFEFAKDEQEELLWHFDGDLNALKIYAAESMG